MSEAIEPRESRTVEEMIRKGRLVRVSTDAQLAAVHIERARGRLRSAQRACDAHDYSECASPLWDAARLSCAAILQAQGLRANGEGHHATTLDAVTEQFGHLLGKLLRTARRLRSERREDQYPTRALLPEPSAQDTKEDIESVTALVNAVHELLPHLPRYH